MYHQDGGSTSEERLPRVGRGVSRDVIAPQTPSFASLMNCRRGWTCGVGRLSAKREETLRGIAISNRIAIPPRLPLPLPLPAPATTPSVYIRAACCSSTFRSRTRADTIRRFPQEPEFPTGPGAGRDGWWRSKGEIQSTKTRRG